MRLLFTLLFATSSIVTSSVWAEFPGWQGLRVIKAENGAYRMVDFQEAGRIGKSLLLVDSRQSRFEIYRYKGPGAIETENYREIENPNYLPMAEDFEKEEIPLERLPQIATVYDLDGDGADEILYVQSDPRKLVLLKRNDAGNWKKARDWEIATSDLSGASPILVRPLEEGRFQVLLSFADGIQTIDLEEGKAEWLQPRERNIERNRWWLSDLDGDGDDDLIEASNSVASPVRWYESEGESLKPALSISEEITNTNVARLVISSKGPKIALLGANQANTLSFYGLGEGAPSRYGKRNLLPIADSVSGNWVSIVLEGKPAIVELSGEKPLLKLYREKDGFWQYDTSFPILKNVKKIVAVRDAENSILLWSDSEPLLYRSVWDGERFSFPRRMSSTDETDLEGKVLTLSQYGETTWWVMQGKSGLNLYKWTIGDVKPVVTLFPDLKDDYEDVVWLGENILLLKKKFAKDTQLARLDGEAVNVVTSKFKGNDLRRIQYFDGALYMAEDGVVQKLDPNLEVIDQIMLEGDLSIRSFAPISSEKAFALEGDGEHLNLMMPDESGIYRSMERYRIPFALQVMKDPVLGLALASANAINVPTEGSSTQIEFETAIDPNENSAREYDKFSIGTIFVIDVNGDGVDEVAAVDYGRRNIIVYGESETGYEEVISWKVFDDGKYPYGSDTGNRSGANPYRMLSLDIDGDSIQDLVLASHDRILIYLAKEDT